MHAHISCLLSIFLIFYWICCLFQQVLHATPEQIAQMQQEGQLVLDADGNQIIQQLGLPDGTLIHSTEHPTNGTLVEADINSEHPGATLIQSTDLNHDQPTLSEAQVTYTADDVLEEDRQLERHDVKKEVSEAFPVEEGQEESEVTYIEHVQESSVPVA